MPSEDETPIDTAELGPSEYLAFRVLHERRNQHGGETGRTQFHKLCCLTDKYLNEKFDRNIGLPKHWYKYGRMVHEGLISDTVTFTPQANHKSGQAYYPAHQVSESDFDHLSEGLKDDIFSAAQAIVEEHGDKSAEELEEHQYKNDAPNDFVEAYGDLRWHLSAQSFKKENQSSWDDFIPDYEPTVMEGLLDDMLINFPEDEYAEVRNEYLLWDDTFRLLYEQGASPRILLEFLEDFIDRLAKVCLRFEDNYNIPDEEIENWKQEKEKEIENLKEDIEKRRSTALASRFPTHELDSVSESYNETIENEIKDI